MTYGGATYGGVAYGSSGAASPDATVTPATIAAAAAFPSAEVNALVIQPSTIAATAAFLAPDVAGSVAIDATAVAVVAAIPSPTVIAAADEYELSVLLDNPTIYYRLGESSGTTAVDSSGNGYDGEYRNGVTLGTAGALAVGSDTAVTTDGVDDYIWKGYDADFLASSWSVEAWFKTTDSLAARVALALRGAELTILYIGSGDVGFKADGTVDGLVSTSGGGYADGEWHYAVGVHEAGVATRLYVDGVLVDTDSAATSPTNATDTGNWAIGYAASATFDGSIDEWAYYAGVVLTDEQVAARYAAAGYGSLAPPVEPTVVAATAAFPTATVSATGTVNVGAATVTASTSFPSPLVGSDDASVSPAAIAATVAFPAATIQSFVDLLPWTEDQSLGTGGVCEWVIEVEMEYPDPTPESGWQPIRTNKVTWPTITVDANGRPVASV